MRITFSFDTLKDLSDISDGEKLIELLLLNGLIIDKAGDYEPIKRDFTISDLPDIWKGRGGNIKSCYFLFKGKKEINFSGMVTWNANLYPNSEIVNGIGLWLNVPKNYSIDWLIHLGDDIFIWSKAEYGYITENSKDPYINRTAQGNIYNGIPGLMWVNYFGSPYLADSEFHIPDDSVSVNHGIRITLSELPNDKCLSDLNYLANIKNKIGKEWFWERPHKYKIKVPVFDNSAITKR